MRMPFKHDVPPPSRMERLRCGASSRAADARHGAQALAGRARPVAMDAASAAQSAAMSVSDAAATAARSVADAANTAAGAMAVRARPVVSEAATRSAAAWTILREGVPPTGRARIAAMMPVAAVGRAVPAATRSKAGSALSLMAIGGLGAAGVMWWRRSRRDAESVWILDETDGDMAAPEGWHEGSSRISSTRAGDSGRAADRVADRAADLADSDSGRKRPDTWP